LRKEIELSEKLLTTGANRKALVTGAAKESFAASHSDINKEEIDSLAKDATSMTTHQVTMKKDAVPGEFAQKKEDLEF